MRCPKGRLGAGRKIQKCLPEDFWNLVRSFGAQKQIKKVNLLRRAAVAFVPARLCYCSEISCLRVI